MAPDVVNSVRTLGSPARGGAAWCLPPTFLGTSGYSQVNTAAGPAGQQRSDGGFAMCATLCIRGQRSFTRAACLPVRPSGLSHLAGAASTLCTGRTLQAHHRATPPRASFWTIRSGSATLLRLALASSAQNGRPWARLHGMATEWLRKAGRAWCVGKPLSLRGRGGARPRRLGDGANMSFPPLLRTPPSIT